MPAPTPKSARHLTLTESQARRIADTVRARRTSAEITQEGLAAAAGLTVGHVRRIERGVTNPTLATLYALATALGTSVGDLVD